MKLEIKLVFDSEENIRTDYIKDTIEALLYEKEELDKNISLYWEKKNIYVCKRKKKNTYKILFGKEK